jgi:hypothetical protein
MKINPTFAAGLCVALLSPLAAHAASTQPNTGFYRIVPYVTAVAPAAVCASFGIGTGPGLSGFFYYPGPSAAGAIYRYASDTSDKIVAQIFPKTPGAGATTWQGVSKEGNEPNPSFPIPFKATITYLDSQSFTAVFTSSVTVGGKTCTVKENVAFYQSGS